MHKISIIIIVKNDRGIENTLDKIALLHKPVETEVIVIDSSDPTRLQDIRDKHPDIAWYYYKNTTGKKFTRPEQRNMGIEKAVGDIIAFIDANCIPVDNWLEELCRPILDGSEHITSGSVRPINPSSVNNLGSEHDTEEHLPESATVNVAFSRRVIRDVGLFDPQFLYGSDVDYTWRAIDAGYKIKSTPKAIVYHDWGNFKEEIVRSVRYGRARAKLYKTHPKRILHIIRDDIRAFAYAAYIVAIPAIVILPWYVGMGYLCLLLIPLYRSRHCMPIKTAFLSLLYGIGVLWGIVSFFQ
jgi:glycosyltransferase involved in cell wall biosynthesis